MMNDEWGLGIGEAVLRVCHLARGTGNGEQLMVLGVGMKRRSVIGKRLALMNQSSGHTKYGA